MDIKEIREKIIKIREGESLQYGKITIKKTLDFVEGGHGLEGLRYNYYKWELEYGNEGDQEYDYVKYTCHNEDEINDCAKAILNGKLI